MDKCLHLRVGWPQTGQVQVGTANQGRAIGGGGRFQVILPERREDEVIELFLRPTSIICKRRIDRMDRLKRPPLAPLFQVDPLRSNNRRCGLARVGRAHPHPALQS